MKALLAIALLAASAAPAAGQTVIWQGRHSWQAQSVALERGWTYHRQGSYAAMSVTVAPADPKVWPAGFLKPPAPGSPVWCICQLDVQTWTYLCPCDSEIGGVGCDINKGGCTTEGECDGS